MLANEKTAEDSKTLRLKYVPSTFYFGAVSGWFFKYNPRRIKSVHSREGCPPCPCTQSAGTWLAGAESIFIIDTMPGKLRHSTEPPKVDEENKKISSQIFTTVDGCVLIMQLLIKAHAGMYIVRETSGFRAQGRSTKKMVSWFIWYRFGGPIRCNLNRIPLNPWIG